MHGRSIGERLSGKRRVAGLVLAGIGGFLIIAAVLFPTYVVGQIVKFPLNEYESATLTGTNVQYFSAKLLTEETGVSEKATYTIKGVAKNGNSSTAVWDEFQYAYDETNGQVQSLSTQRAAFNRRTAQLSNCCGANVNGHKVNQSGIVGWVFPFGVQKQTYGVFDTTLDKPEPFVYSGTADTLGVQTYKFVENIPPTQFATLQVPGYFVGSSAKTVSVPELYEIHQIYWVDPETGALLNVNNFEELTVRNPVTGTTGVVLYKGDLAMTPSSLQTIVNLDKNGRNELSLLSTILPLVAGIVGAILVVAGILLGRRRRGDAGTESTTMPLSAMAPPVVPEQAPSPAADLDGHASPDGHASEPAAESTAAESAPAGTAPAESSAGDTPKGSGGDSA
jgi:hypothetical protein